MKARRQRTRQNTSTISSVGSAAKRWPDLNDFLNAFIGSGPYAANWADKPHRLVYDLIKLVAEARGLLTKQQQKNLKRRIKRREIAQHLPR